MTPADWLRMAELAEEGACPSPFVALLRREAERAEAAPKLKTYRQLQRDIDGMKERGHDASVLQELQDRVWREMTPAQRAMLDEP